MAQKRKKKKKRSEDIVVLRLGSEPGHPATTSMI